MRKRRSAALVLGAAMITVSTVLVVAAAAAIQDVDEYAVGIAEGYETESLLSVGDTVPETSNDEKEFQMIGIPDGLGAHGERRGRKTVYMNHELTGSTLSEPVVGDPLNRGAFVSKLKVDRRPAPAPDQ